MSSYIIVELESNLHKSKCNFNQIMSVLFFLYIYYIQYVVLIYYIAKHYEIVLMYVAIYVQNLNKSA